MFVMCLGCCLGIFEDMVDVLFVGLYVIDLLKC